jgi:predicted dehydrogenase
LVQADQWEERLPVALKVVVIAAGRMAREHAAAVVAAGDKVIAVIDPDVTRAEALAAEHQASAGASQDDIVEILASLGLQFGDVAFVIASPSALHLEQAVTAAERGSCVLLEKPPWIPGQDPLPLLAAPPDDVRIAVGMTTRFSIGIQALRSAVQSGQLGSILRVSDLIAFSLAADRLPEWYFDPQMSGGGVVVTNGVHSVDRLSWILGLPLQLQSASLSSGFLHSCDDTAVLELRAGHVLVSSTLLWSLGPVPSSQLLIVGDEGSAWTDAAGNWMVSSIRGTASGSPPSGHDNLKAQWRSFRSFVTTRKRDDVLPRLGDLALSMALLDEVMASRSQDYC